MLITSHILQYLQPIVAILALCFSIASAVQIVNVQGSDFVNTVTRERFQIIGVAYESSYTYRVDRTLMARCRYQPGGSSGFNPGSGIDPLSNGTVCLRDAALMQRLGVNTIRVYNLDPSLNHDDCASIFNSVGIYMLLDVNSPLGGQSINRADPSSSYDSDYLSRVFGVVEAFKNYPNLLGFFSGNEVINDDPSGGVVPPYLRAVTRDLKNYIAKHSTRTIPVGYSAAQVADILTDTWQYLQCAINNGTASDVSRIDFFGLNSYSWCGSSATFESSGYNVLVSQFANTTIPVFFSEYGCNTPAPRVFNEVQSLYGPQMTPVFSGGLVYEYSQEVSNFGLVAINSNDTVSIRSDFDSLQGQYNKLDIKNLESGNSTATSLQPPTCSSNLIKTQGFYNQFNIPDVPPGAQSLIDNGIQNPNNGKLVPVTQDKVQMAVYSSNGAEIQNLAITPLPDDQSNTPGGQNTSGAATESGSSTGASATSSSKPTSTTKGAAGKMQVESILGLVAAVAAAMWYL